MVSRSHGTWPLLGPYWVQCLVPCAFPACWYCTGPGMRSRLAELGELNAPRFELLIPPIPDVEQPNAAQSDARFMPLAERLPGQSGELAPWCWLRQRLQWCLRLGSFRHWWKLSHSVQVPSWNPGHSLTPLRLDRKLPLPSRWSCFAGLGALGAA